MMPLSLAGAGDIVRVRKIGGNAETKKFLENLGFFQGGELKVISKISGNLIVQVKESRVAISREMANKIMV